MRGAFLFLCFSGVNCSDPDALRSTPPTTLPVHHEIGDHAERSLECVRRWRAVSTLSHSDWRSGGQRRLEQNVCGMGMGVAYQIFGLSWEVGGQRDAILNVQVDHLSTRADDLRTRVDNLSARVDDLSARVDDLSTQVDNLTNEVREVRKLLNTLLVCNIVLMAIFVITSTLVLCNFCRPNAPVPPTPALTPSRCRPLLTCGPSTERALVDIGRKHKVHLRGPSPSAIPFPNLL